MWWLERIGIFVEIVVQNVYRIREIEIHNWWLWTRKMYWGLGLLPGTSQKWKVSPIGKSRLCAKSGICFNWIKCLFCHFPGREYSYFSSMFIVLIFAGNWICKLVAFSNVRLFNFEIFYLFTILKYLFCLIRHFTLIL